MASQYKEYNVISNQYDRNQSVVMDVKCNGWTAINIGTTLVMVNGIPLNAGTPGTNNGESVTFGGNEGEVFKGRVDLVFPNGPGLVLIFQKYYL